MGNFRPIRLMVCPVLVLALDVSSVPMSSLCSISAGDNVGSDSMFLASSNLRRVYMMYKKVPIMMRLAFPFVVSIKYSSILMTVSTVNGGAWWLSPFRLRLAFIAPLTQCSEKMDTSFRSLNLTASHFNEDSTACALVGGAKSCSQRSAYRKMVSSVNGKGSMASALHQRMNV